MDSSVLDEKSARQYLDRRLQENDVQGAIDFANKEQNRFPKLKKLLHFLGNNVVQASTDDEEMDWYSVLGVDPSSDIRTIKQHYKKLAKDNKIKSQEVHKLIDRAWNTLSNKFTRRDYDRRRCSRQIQQNAFVAEQASSSTQLLQPEPVSSDATGNNISGVEPLPSATETIQPVPGLHNFCGNNGEDLASISAATNSIKLTPDVYNVSGNKEPGPISVSTDTPLIQPALGMHSISGNNKSGLTMIPSDTHLILPRQGQDNIRGNGESGPTLVPSATQSIQQVPGMYTVSENVGVGPSLVFSTEDSFQTGSGVDIVSKNSRSGPELVSSAEPSILPVPSTYNVCKNIGRSSLVEGTCDSSKNVSATNMLTGTGSNSQKGVQNVSQEEVIPGVRREKEKVHGSGSTKRNSKKKLPDFNRNILMEMARNMITNKLNELNASAKDTNEPKPADNKGDAAIEGLKEEELKTMEVPDPEFHDFDGDRTKEFFSENQVWAVYDEDDGMPRLYALIRKAPKRSSKLQVSWLNSESSMEPESLNWIDSEFHKTCGNFYIQKEKMSIKLNSFSHRVARWKNESNVVQIFPKKGDVWALYRNWSPEWSKHTTEEEKHKYEMVEVLGDYDEDKGVTIVPLVKVAGFKAVFCQHSDTTEVRIVPKEEIFRFSHQVSSYLLTEQDAPNVPKSSKELDPAAMPLELLQVIH